MDNHIYHHSAQDLSLLPEESITLTITSPPYWNAIDYSGHNCDPNVNYRTRTYDEEYSSYEEYLDWMVSIFKNLWPKTKPGGFLAIVIGTVLLEKKLYPVPMDITSCLKEEGWEFWQDIIWNKVTGGVKRAGSFIQYPYPGYYRPNIMNEYILIFHRPGEALYKERTKEEKEESRTPINKIFTREIANNIWHIAPVPPKHLDHPCPFPEEIPYRLITLYSYKGDLIFDPFNGSGQTTKVARWLERRYIGFDTKESYVEYARKRLKEPFAIRQQQLLCQIEKIPMDAPLDRKKKRKTRHGSGLFSKNKDQ